MKRRPLPDLRNARAGIEPKRLTRVDAAVKPLGLKIMNAASDPDTTELWIYDEIGLFWGISSQDIADALATVTTPNVRVRINSPGGDVFEGIAIMNLLASWNGTVTGVVDALCASIATVIAMACESITMSPGSQMMIHPASGVCFGDEADMQQMAALLGFQTNNIAGLYAARAGGDQADWLALMAAETWMTADEAVTAGLADATGVVKQSGVSAAPPAPDYEDMFWDLSIYKFAGRDNAADPIDQAWSRIRAAMAAGECAGVELKVIQNCSCGPKGFRVVDRDGQHLEACVARGALTPRPVNLPDPVGVQWEVVSNGNACDICEDVIDASPYDEDDLPDVPVHPNCDCDLQVAYGVNNHTPADPITAHFLQATAAAMAAEQADELVRNTMREVFA